MISSDITGALATLHIQDMRRTAEASRTAAAAQHAQTTTTTVRGMAAGLRRRARGMVSRGQLGPVHNYVTR